MRSKNHARRFALRAALVCVLSACGVSALPAVAAAAEGIKGTVTNAETAEPITGAKACLYESTSETQIHCEPTNAKGEYEIIGPSAGTYKVRFEASGYTPQWYLKQTSWASATTVTVKSGVVTPNIEAAMVETGFGSIAGQVTSNGQGIGGIEVCADGPSYRCTETDGNGRYTLSALGVGSYTVSFSPKENSCEEELGVKVRCVINANVIGQSVNSVHVKAGEEPTPVNVALQAGGQISGTVTNASITHPGIGKIEVWADHVNSKGEYECCGYSHAWTNASGAYTISGLSTGSYRVGFYGDLCTEVARAERKEEECVITYVSTYYHEKASFEKGETVNVTAGSNTSGINENLREAFPTTPASTAAPALTGTPVVGQALSCSQGSWSHEPTYLAYQWLRNGTPIAGQTGSTYTVQAADPGKSITCVVWAGNGAGVASATSNAVAVPVPQVVVAGAKVKGTVALVALRCPGPGACSGTLKLVARVTTRHGKRKKTSNVTIGAAPFSVTAGKSLTLKVRLTAQGRKLMAKAGKKGLKVQINGSGVKARIVTLKAAAPKGKKK